MTWPRERKVRERRRVGWGKREEIKGRKVVVERGWEWSSQRIPFGNHFSNGGLKIET